MTTLRLRLPGIEMPKTDKERITQLEQTVALLISALESEGLITFLDCNDCKDGYWPDGDTCPECRGTGMKL